MTSTVQVPIVASDESLMLSFKNIITIISNNSSLKRLYQNHLKEDFNDVLEDLNPILDDA